MSTLHLTLKKKFFDMIASGEKTEEYRSIKDYWVKRLVYGYEKGPSMPTPMSNLAEHWSKIYDHSTGMTVFDALVKNFDTITFRNGYAKNAPTMVVECSGITIGPARPEWSDNWQGDAFIIKLGKIISRS